MTSCRRLASGLLLALVTASPLVGQTASDPRADFLQGLAQFREGLAGTYGDEGLIVKSSLASMERGLEQWDATIRTYEAAMASRSAPQVTARMHFDLGKIYLDRGRVSDGLRELSAASQLAPGRGEIFLLQGLAFSHPQVNQRAAAIEAYRKAAALDPENPLRAYILARELRRAGAQEEALAVLRVVGRSLKLASTDASRAAAQPFLQFGILPEQSRGDPFFPPVLYAEGFTLLQRGEYAQAIVEFRNAASRDPLVAERVGKTDAVGRAAEAFRDQSIDLAVVRLKASIELAPDRAELHRILGAVYLANQQNEEAVAELQAAVQLNPGDERTRLALAKALMETAQYPEAERALLDTLNVFPASGRGRHELGRLAQLRGHQADALRLFNEALTFNPLLGLNDSHRGAATINDAGEDLDAAIDANGKWIDVHPNDASAHQRLGDMYASLGRYDEAVAEFAVVLMLNPKQAAAYAAVAQVYLRNGRYADAVEASRRAVEIDPANQQGRYALGTSLMRLGRTDEGTKEFDAYQRVQTEIAAAQLRARKLDGLRRNASVSVASGDHEKAISLLREALDLAPDAVASHMYLGLALFKAGHFVEALDQFTSTVALNGPFEVHQYMAKAHAALGHVDAAGQELFIYEQLKHEHLKRAGPNR